MENKNENCYLGFREYHAKPCLQLQLHDVGHAVGSWKIYGSVVVLCKSFVGQNLLATAALGRVGYGDCSDNFKVMIFISPFDDAPLFRSSLRELLGSTTNSYPRDLRHSRLALVIAHLVCFCLGNFALLANVLTKQRPCFPTPFSPSARDQLGNQQQQRRSVETLKARTNS